MRFGNAFLAGAILRQSFQTELPESSPKGIAPWVGTKLGPLKNDFVAGFWCLAFYYRHGLMPLNWLQKHDLKQVATYSILWVPVFLDSVIKLAVFAPAPRKEEEHAIA